LSRTRKVFFTILRRSALIVCMITFADVIGLGFISIFFWRNVFHYYTLLTLLESALLFLIGGAQDLSGSLAFTRIFNRISRTDKEWTFNEGRRAQEKAAPLILAGVMLFCLSFILAYPLG